jgi:16S rRNA (guanine527-N7)-methyltransferase
LGAIPVEGLIAEGLDYFDISYTPAMMEKLSLFIHELERWNRRINLTGIRPVEWIVRELLYDTFFLHSLIRGSSSVLDMGSGSGVLAIPLAILDEAMEVVSVDRTLKKIQFQRHIKRNIGLDNLRLMHDRIESMEPLHVDALLAKAFGSTRLILQKGARHLKGEGTAYLLKGRSASEGQYPGFTLERKMEYRLPDNPKEYQLFVYKKVS